MAGAGDLEEIYFVIEEEEGFPIEEVKVSRGGSGKEIQMGASSPLLKRVKRLPPRMMMRSFRDRKSAFLAKVSTGGTPGRSTLMMRLRTLPPRRLIHPRATSSMEMRRPQRGRPPNSLCVWRGITSTRNQKTSMTIAMSLLTRKLTNSMLRGPLPLASMQSQT
jgi:hypothetical protein